MLIDQLQYVGVVKQAVLLHAAGVGMGNDTSSIPPADAMPLGCDGVVHIKTEPRNGTPMKVNVKGCLCACRSS